MLLDFGLKMLSSALSKASNDRQIENQISEIDNRKDELDEWYNKESGTSYLNTAEGQSAMTALSSDKREQEEALVNRTISSGATPEAAVAMASEINKGYAEALSEVASEATSRQKSIDNIYGDMSNQLQEDRDEALEGQTSIWSYIF